MHLEFNFQKKLKLKRAVGVTKVTKCVVLFFEAGGGKGCTSFQAVKTGRKTSQNPYVKRNDVGEIVCANAPFSNYHSSSLLYIYVLSQLSVTFIILLIIIINITHAFH